MPKMSPWTGDDVRAYQEATGLTNERLAERLRVSIRTIANWRKQYGAALPDLGQRVLTDALDNSPEPVRQRFLAFSASKPVRADLDVKALVAAAADEADADQLRFGGNIDTETLEWLWAESLEVARAGNRPAVDAFTAARTIRVRALELTSQTSRPGVLSDLYRIAGQATALMASSAFDLNQWDASASLARSAISQASLAGHRSLEAWTIGLAALLANWRGEPDTALRLIQRGMQAAQPGSPRVRLRFIASRSYALLGDSKSVATMLDNARHDQQEADNRHDDLADEIGGEFAFGSARAEACAAASWLDIGDGAKARAAAERAIAELAVQPTGRLSVSQFNGARIDMATACLLNNDLDEAAELLAAVFGQQRSLTNMSLSGRLVRVRKTLLSPAWSKDSRAHDLADTIGDWLSFDPAMTD
jgi:transcriptional regulator with XRE-family HTH domain